MENQIRCAGTYPLRGLPVSDESITISMVSMSVAEANALANDLADSLLDSVPHASIGRARTDRKSQDFGTAVVVMLSAPAMVKLADGLSKWLARRSEARLEMRRTDKNGKERRITVDGHLGARRVEQLVREFLSD